MHQVLSKEFIMYLQHVTCKAPKCISAMGARPALAGAGPNARPSRGAPLTSGALAQYSNYMNIERTANYWRLSVCRLHDKTIVFMGRWHRSCVPQLRPCLWWLIACCCGGHQTVYRYHSYSSRNLLWKLCNGAASASAKLRQSNRTDKCSISICILEQFLERTSWLSRNMS